MVFEFDHERAKREINLKLVPSKSTITPFPTSAFMQVNGFAIDTQIRNLIETYGYAEVMTAFVTRFQGSK